MNERQRFYSQSQIASFTSQDVLEGRAIKINPALITITDGLVDTITPEELQDRVETHVRELLCHRIRTFHADINFPDYHGFGTGRPDINTNIFTPPFLFRLNSLIRANGAFLNLHLLTDAPRDRLRAFAGIPLGAVCFQLDAVPEEMLLSNIIDDILQIGACASPVIETIGAGDTSLMPHDTVLSLLEPVLPRIGMITIQAAGTAARSNAAQGLFAGGPAGSYMRSLRPIFEGTFQIQGGVKTESIGQVVHAGAEFLVCGTEIFRHPAGRKPEDVIDSMLQAAAQALRPGTEAPI